MRRNDTTNYNRPFSTNTLKHPCAKGCPDRGPGCAARCEKWQQYEKARNQQYDERAKRRGDK
jgi:hypothetical protein